MAQKTRSSVFALKEESSEGVLALPTSADDFIALREGFSMQSAVETVDSDELVNDIGMSKGFLGKETPSGSLPKYFKHSGVEGQAPDYALLLKCAMGTQVAAPTERDTVAGSTAGSSSVAAVINVDTGEGAGFTKGQALMIKDETNGYSIRNIKSISNDALTLNYNLANAPASGVLLGRPILFAPSPDGHPTFSAHLYQSSSAASAYQQSIAGCRVTSTNIEFNANELATISFDYEGIKYFYNPIEITSSTRYLDFEDSGNTVRAVQLSVKIYKTPMELAREVETKLNSVGPDTYTCSWDNSAGKFVITANAANDFLVTTGVNVANTAWGKLGFTSNKLAATTATADNAQSYAPAYTPSPDTSDPNVVRNNELLFGDFAKISCRAGSSVSFSISTPKTDVDSYCAETGVMESVIMEREVTMSATLILQKHEVAYLDTFLNNGSTQLMFNHGAKSNGNWVPGKCVNVWLENASITSHVIADSDGFQVIELEARGYVNSAGKDVWINFV